MVSYTEGPIQQGQSIMNIDSSDDTSNADATTLGDVANDIRSQQRSDVQNTPIEDSTSSGGDDNVSVTGTGTDNVTIQTPDSTTVVDRTGASSEGPQNTTTPDTTSTGSDDPPPANTTRVVAFDGAEAVTVGVVLVAILTVARVLT